MYSFATPPIKLKLGQQIGEEITNSKPLGQIIMMPIRNTEQQLDHIYFITLFSAGAQRCCCAFHEPQQRAQLCEGKKPIS
jgi:hypothetical protein